MTSRPRTGKLKPSTWKEANSTLHSAAATFRSSSEVVRSNTHSLTRHTSGSLQRTARNTENSLSLRVDEILQRKSDLQRAIEDTFQETGNMLNHKDLLEQELQAKTLPLEISNECIDYRKGRYGVDDVDDLVDEELGAEVEIITEIQDTLKRNIEDAVEQIRLLRAAKYQMESDLKDKFEAFEIDRTCVELETTSRHLDYHQDSVRVDHRSLDPGDWHGYTNTNVDRARSEIANSIGWRTRFDDVMKDTNDRLTKQANKVEETFNSRIAECREAKQSSEQHLAETQLEVSAQGRAIQHLEQEYDAKKAPMMVAQTRLSKRSNRPNVELVKDPAQYALVREVEEIDQTMQNLKEQLNEAEDIHRSLMRAALALEEDIACKSNSLNIDNRCMQRRQQYKYRTV